MKNAIKALIFVLMFVSVFSVAQAAYTSPGIQITDLVVSPNPIDFSLKPSVNISYKTNAEARVTLSIYKGSDKIGTFVNNQLLSTGGHSYYWNGKYGSDTQVGTVGQPVVNGIYSFTITAVNSGQVASGVSSQAVKSGTITVGAGSVGGSTNIDITNVSVSPIPVDFGTDASVSISYKTTTESYVTLVISQGSKRVGTFVNGQYLATGAHAYYWNGKYGSDTQVGKSGQSVPEGIYSFTITAVKSGTATAGVANQAIKTGTITVSSDTSDSDNSGSGDFAITQVDLSEDAFDPSDDEEVEITFEMNDDANVTIKIYDDDDDLVRELIDSDNYDQGENSETWNGEDDNEDVVSDGDYTYKIHADNGPEEDDVDGIVTVGSDNGGDKVDDPEIENAYVTKESFDSEEEYTYIVFTLISKADIKVSIYDKNDDLVETIYDKNDRPSDTYKIKWDGSDSEVGVYTYKINVDNNKGKDSFNGDIEIATDESTEGAPNISKDKINLDKIPFSSKDGELPITFILSEDADEVTLEIRKGNKSIDKVLNKEDLEEGNHTAKWDGLNKSGKAVEDGVYEYKIIAKNDDGTDTETGNFSVSKPTTPPAGTKCAGFKDISSTYKFCEAVTWAKDEGIFAGYPDNSFKPYQSIRRAEILKVVLEAFKINEIGTNGGNIGFKDVKGYEWYMNYLATSISMGIVKGYNDNTFRPDEVVTRTQALKIMLEAAKNKFKLSIPSNNFGQPYVDTPAGQWYTKYVWVAKSNELNDNETYFFPFNPMTRGEMADMLYRFHKAELDQ